MKPGDIVHGVVPEFSKNSHYFIIVYNKIKTFTLLPITSKNEEWDICIGANCFSIKKEKIKQGDISLKTLPSYLFLGLFAIGKQCCTQTDFKASPALLEKLRKLNLIKLI